MPPSDTCARPSSRRERASPSRPRCWSANARMRRLCATWVLTAFSSNPSPVANSAEIRSWTASTPSRSPSVTKSISEMRRSVPASDAGSPRNCVAAFSKVSLAPRVSFDRHRSNPIIRYASADRRWSPSASDNAAARSSSSAGRPMSPRPCSAIACSNTAFANSARAPIAEAFSAAAVALSIARSCSLASFTIRPRGRSSSERRGPLESCEERCRPRVHRSGPRTAPPRSSSSRSAPSCW